MWDTAEKIMKGVAKLVPPAGGASDAHVRRWRLWIAAATFLNAFGLSVHIALACGFAAPFYSGFAQASAVQRAEDKLKGVEEEQKKRRITELTGLILDTRAKHCKATGDVKSLYLRAYNDLRQEYFELTKREFPRQECKDFE